MFKVILYSSHSEIEAININLLLDHARKKNRRLGITGYLICHIKGFIQLIEGEATEIDALTAAISSDDRHRDVVIQGETYTEHRFFPEWDMGLMRMSDVSSLDIENPCVPSDEKVQRFVKVVNESKLTEEPTP